MNPTLANFIIHNQPQAVEQLLGMGADINGFDEFGFTPLIESAIANHTHIAKMLLEHGACPNKKDLIGGTPLHWAVENNNLDMARLLLEHKADPNAQNLSAEPVLVKPILREHKVLKHLLFEHGASSRFANDYIQLKLLGHRYDLKGELDIVNTEGGFAELSFEGFFLESSIHILRQSLQQYTANFGARKNAQYFPTYRKIIDSLHRAADLFKFQQYQIKLNENQAEINSLLDHELLILPVNYDGHAIAFIRYGNLLVRCDRRKDEERVNGIVIFEMTQPDQFSNKLMKFLLYEKKEADFMNVTLIKKLGLKTLGRMMIEPQVTGNCSWANIAACVPAAFFLLTDNIDNYPSGIVDYDHTALKQYRDWRDWDKTNALNYCVNNFESADKSRKLTFGAALAAVFFQRIDHRDSSQLDLARKIYRLLKQPDSQHHLNNYLGHYYSRKRTPAGINLKKLMDNCENYY